MEDFFKGSGEAGLGIDGPDDLSQLRIRSHTFETKQQTDMNRKRMFMGPLVVVVDLLKRI
jgi:hypothetical protein